MDYTEGEWATGHTMDNGTTILCHDKKDVLCTIRWSARAVPENEQKSNAKLFTASSNMYEALKAVRTKVNAWSGTGKFQDLMDEMLDVNASLDKAEGK